jgi:hypothetical protein
MAAVPGPGHACPRCGAAQAAEPGGGGSGDGGGGCDGGPYAPPPLLAPPPATVGPASQPDDAAAPGLDAVTGGAAPCTTCGFILDEAVWDGRPALQRDRDDNAGAGGRASGGGEGVFLAATAGAEEAAGAWRVFVCVDGCGRVHGLAVGRGACVFFSSPTSHQLDHLPLPSQNNNSRGRRPHGRGRPAPRPAVHDPAQACAWWFVCALCARLPGFLLQKPATHSIPPPRPSPLSQKK